MTRKIKAKIYKRSIPRDTLEETRQQLAEYWRFLDLVKQFTEVNEKLCDLLPKAGQEKNSAPSQCEALSSTFAAEVQQEIEFLLGAHLFSATVDIEALENSIKRNVVKFVAKINSSILNADRSDCLNLCFRM